MGAFVAIIATFLRKGRRIFRFRLKNREKLLSKRISDEKRDFEVLVTLFRNGHAYDLTGFKRSIRSLGAASVAAGVAEDRVRELKREDGGKVQKKKG